MWLMKTLLTSGCTNQRGAGQNISKSEWAVLPGCLQAGVSQKLMYATLRKFGARINEALALKELKFILHPPYLVIEPGTQRQWAGKR